MGGYDYVLLQLNCLEVLGLSWPSSHTHQLLVAECVDDRTLTHIRIPNHANHHLVDVLVDQFLILRFLLGFLQNNLRLLILLLFEFSFVPDLPNQLLQLTQEQLSVGQFGCVDHGQLLSIRIFWFLHYTQYVCLLLLRLQVDSFLLLLGAEEHVTHIICQQVFVPHLSHLLV